MGGSDRHAPSAARHRAQAWSHAAVEAFARQLMGNAHATLDGLGRHAKTVKLATLGCNARWNAQEVSASLAAGTVCVMQG